MVKLNQAKFLGSTKKPLSEKGSMVMEDSQEKQDSLFPESKEVKQRPTVALALRAISEKCDGASSRDFQGFNAVHAHFGNYTAALPEALWGAEAMWIAYNEVLPVYKKQLTEYGINYDEIEPPPCPDSVKRGTVSSIHDVNSLLVESLRQYRRQQSPASDPEAVEMQRKLLLEQRKQSRICSFDKEAQEFHLQFMYDGRNEEEVRILNRVRCLKQRRFINAQNNGATEPYWSSPIICKDEVMAIAKDFGFTIVEGAEQVQLPESLPGYRLEFNKDSIAVFFPYDPSLVEAIKEVPGRRFVKKDDLKYWQVPNNRLETLQALFQVVSENIGFHPTEKERVAQFISALEQKSQANVEMSTALATDIPPWMVEKFSQLGLTLRPFQEVGVAFGHSNGNVLICDDMGVGKTIEALSLVHVADLFPALVVCPASLKLNWCKEAATWLPKRTISVNFPKKKPVALWTKNGEILIPTNDPNVDVFITNYEDIRYTLLSTEKHGEDVRTQIREELQEQLENGEVQDFGFDQIEAEVEARLQALADKKNESLQQLMDRGFKIVIFDESQHLKHAKSAQTKGAKMLARKIGKVVELSGTPVENRPIELVSQLDILGRLHEFGGFWSFVKDYCDAHKTDRGFWDFKGCNQDRMLELNQLLRSKGIMIRRKKKDVLDELPDKQRTSIPFSITNRTEYDEAHERFMAWMWKQVQEISRMHEQSSHMSFSERAEFNKRFEAYQRAFRAEHLVRIERLKQLAVEGKFASIMDWIENFVDTGEPLVVFGIHTDFLKRISSHFNAPLVVGETPLQKRQQAVDDFQAGREKLIVMNIEAGGTGHTLTAASNVMFFELAWHPMKHDQAEDRAYRYGTKNAVNVWYLIARNTIEEDLAHLIESKRMCASGIIDGTQTSPSEGLIGDLTAFLLRQKESAEHVMDEILSQMEEVLFD